VIQGRESRKRVGSAIEVLGNGGLKRGAFLMEDVNRDQSVRYSRQWITF
jgi:hypothetical protein